MLNKLLWQQNNKTNFIIANIGLTLGLFFALSSLEIYFVLNKAIKSGGGNPYVIVQKPVSFLNTLGMKNVFEAEDIEALEALANVEEIGVFISNQFKASVSSDLAPFYSELFFESVPDNFMDVDMNKFVWNETDQQVNIVLPRAYLTLYNFGFAPSQNLPQFTEATIGQLPLNINIKKNGQKTILKGKIIGFSDRINSILVPQDFLNWANQKFGSKESSISRLILKVNNPNDKAFLDFIKEEGYEKGGGVAIDEGVVLAIYTVLAFVLGIGFLLLLLSAVIIFLFFKLVITDSSTSIKRLAELGYSPQGMLSFWEKKWMVSTAFIVTIVLVLLILAKMLLAHYANQFGFLTSNWPSLTSFIVFISIVIILFIALRSFLKKSLNKIIL